MLFSIVESCSAMASKRKVMGRAFAGSSFLACFYYHLARWQAMVANTGRGARWTWPLREFILYSRYDASLRRPPRRINSPGVIRVFSHHPHDDSLSVYAEAFFVAPSVSARALALTFGLTN